MNLYKEITTLLARGDNLVLASILNRSGSAPRSVGSRMVVRPDGSILGTIGGGILEARVRKLAEEVFRTGRTLVRDFTLTAEDASLMGMICGGQVRVMIHHLDASDSSQSELYRNLAAVLHSRRQAWLVTRIPREDGDSAHPECGLLEMNELLAGTLEPDLTRQVITRFGGRQPDIVEYGEKTFLVEPLGREGCVVIFGAGHISHELAPLVRRVGFRTVVCDDRAEFANRDRFPTADEVLVLDSFDGVMEGLDIGEESYLVLVTRGHAYDKTVLAQALGTSACYIGMIGSRRKRDAIYEALLREEFTRADLDRVCSPIGLDIGAETPEEIAVSIVAELIQARARRNG
ncbi:MAG: XdhC family protein [Syntrophobacteraceae bacterium]|jgi:xanthine dehydrogenase accessory factor|nr:XdhC family protein [Syntrophobacteraceae bacterium]